MVDNKNNSTCSICGKEYHKCLSCKDSMQLTPWKKFTDTSEHYKIYQIIHGFSVGVYDKAEAKERLLNVDTSDVQTYREHIKNIVLDILNYNELPTESVENIIEDNVEENVEDIMINENNVTKESILDFCNDKIEDSYSSFRTKKNCKR